jgi:hypothetical protein
MDIFIYSINTFPMNSKEQQKIIHLWIRSRDNSVSMATSYGLDNSDGRGSSLSRIKNCLLSTSSKPAPGRVKRQGREGDPLTLNSANVNKTWIFASIPHMRMALCLIKQSDNFSLYY